MCVCVQELEFLNRRVRLVAEGLEPKAGDKHACRRLHEWGMTNCNGADAPTSTTCAVNRGAELTLVDARRFRTCTAILNYIYPDRVDFGFTTKVLAQTSSCRR